MSQKSVNKVSKSVLKMSSKFPPMYTSTQCTVSNVSSTLSPLKGYISRDPAACLTDSFSSYLRFCAPTTHIVPCSKEGYITTGGVLTEPFSVRGCTLRSPLTLAIARTMSRVRSGQWGSLVTGVPGAWWRWRLAWKSLLPRLLRLVASLLVAFLRRTFVNFEDTQ